MGDKPDQPPQQNPMDGMLDQQQQVKLAEVKTADDLKHFLEQKALDALSAEQKAEVQKYWEEHDSPQALEAAKKAQAQCAAEDKALMGGMCAVIGAFTATDVGLAGRVAGAQGLQGLSGNQGSTMISSLGNTFMALLGSPDQALNGTTTPPAYRNNSQSTYSA